MIGMPMTDERAKDIRAVLQSSAAREFIHGERADWAWRVIGELLDERDGRSAIQPAPPCDNDHIAPGCESFPVRGDGNEEPKPNNPNWIADLQSVADKMNEMSSEKWEGDGDGIIWVSPGETAWERLTSAIEDAKRAFAQRQEESLEKLRKGPKDARLPVTLTDAIRHALRHGIDETKHDGARSHMSSCLALINEHTQSVVDSLTASASSTATEH